MISHLPVLQVIIPLIAAPLSALFRNGKISWLIAMTATCAAFVVAILQLYTVYLYNSPTACGGGRGGCLFQDVRCQMSDIRGKEYSSTTNDLMLKTKKHPPLPLQHKCAPQAGGEKGIDVSYEMGNWKPPIGIEYRADILNTFILSIVTFVSSIMIFYAYRSVENEIPKKKHPLFYTMYLLCFTGILGIVSTNDIFNIYVFLEISSLSTYTLIAMGRDRRALTASFQYLILGTVGATFILIGIGFLYIMTGTLNISDIASRLGDVTDPRPVQAAFAFITLGLALKIALFPLHIWLTNAYAYSPSFISAFLSATATKVSIYVFIRLIFDLFGYEYSFVEMPLGIILMTLAIAGILIGSLTAIYQPNVKRMLGFSSVAQLGYIALGLGLATTAGVTAGIVHIANHAFAKGLLFLAVGAVFYRTGGVRIENFKGIAKKMPLTMAAFLVGGFSLIGVPGTAGFVSKWSFLSAILEEGMWPLAVVMLISTILAIIYIWRVVEVAYFCHPEPTCHPERSEGSHECTSKDPSTSLRYAQDDITEAPLSMLVPMFILAFANIYFGIYTDVTLDIASMAAENLFSGVL